MPVNLSSSEISLDSAGCGQLSTLHTIRPRDGSSAGGPIRCCQPQKAKGSCAEDQRMRGACALEHRLAWRWSWRESGLIASTGDGTWQLSSNLAIAAKAVGLYFVDLTVATVVSMCCFIMRMPSKGSWQPT